MSENVEPDVEAVTEPEGPSAEQIQKLTEEAIKEAEAATPESIPVEDLAAEQLRQTRAALAELTNDEMEEAVTALRAHNAQTYNKLLNEGQQLDPSIIMMQRLEALIQFGLDDTARLRVDVMFERQMAGMLEEAEHQARVQKLTAGLGNLPPGDILKGKLPNVPQPRKRK